MNTPHDEPLRILVIYDRTRDLPDCVTVRGHRAHADGTTSVELGAVAFSFANEAEHALALAAARRHCASLGAFQQARHPDDDPVIIETWIF